MSLLNSDSANFELYNSPIIAKIRGIKMKNEKETKKPETSAIKKPVKLRKQIVGILENDVTAYESICFKFN